MPIIIKIKILPIISALFLVVAMAIQSAVSYNREKNSVVNLIENRMELAQKNLIYEVYDMYEVTDEISLTMNHGTWTITLTDNGVAFDPTTCPEVDTDQVVAERQIGGQGIALLRQIADDIQYRRKDGQNELMIIKNI